MLRPLFTAPQERVGSAAPQIYPDYGCYLLRKPGSADAKDPGFHRSDLFAVVSRERIHVSSLSLPDIPDQGCGYKPATGLGTERSLGCLRLFPCSRAPEEWSTSVSSKSSGLATDRGNTKYIPIKPAVQKQTIFWVTAQFVGQCKVSSSE